MSFLRKLYKKLKPLDTDSILRYAEVEYGRHAAHYILSRVKAGATLDEIRREMR